MANTSSYALRPVVSGSTDDFNKLTVSCWFKGNNDGVQRSFWGIFDQTSSNRFFHLYFSSNGSLYGYWRQNEGIFFTLGTMQKFRDPNAWYHFVMTMDTTLSTAADRVKFYVNGERITEFEDSLDTITQNQQCNILVNTDGRTIWGAGKQSGTLYYWDGALSHCHMTVGYAYGPGEFGETDSTTGTWKIKTTPSVTYGNNGGFWFKDSSALTDHSSNSNDLTISGGTLTTTVDNPSNNLSIANVLFNPDPGNGSLGSIANGNTTFTTNYTSQSIMGVSTVGATSGKYYCEMKLTGESGTGEAFAGMGYDIYANATTSMNADSSFMWNVCSNGAAKQGGSDTGAGNWSNTYTTNDIISVAMDLDNNKVYFAKNGQYADGSGNWDEAFTGSPAHANITAGKMYYFCAGDKSTSQNATWSINFGNGFFGTTAVASAGTNASGNGIFEYDVPSGFTALSTKGINL